MKMTGKENIMKSEQDIKDMIHYRKVTIEKNPKVFDREILEEEIKLLEFILHD